MSSNDWSRFMWQADEFFILYVLSCKNSLSQCTMFLVGHAVELYLKAVLTKQTGNIKEAINLGHNIKELLGKCKENDKSFMPHFDFSNQEFLTILDNLPDLKYLGVMKKRNKFSFGFIAPNDYWINFVKEIRKYLDYPGRKYLDIIKEFVRREGNQNIKSYLHKIYES